MLIIIIIIIILTIIKLHIWSHSGSESLVSLSFQTQCQRPDAHHQYQEMNTGLSVTLITYECQYQADISQCQYLRTNYIACQQKGPRVQLDRQNTRRLKSTYSRQSLTCKLRDQVSCPAGTRIYPSYMLPHKQHTVN